LIGGKSSRFGSDKGLFNFQGKPLVDYQLAILSRFNHDIFLVANSKYQVQNYINSIDINKVMGFVIDDEDIKIKQESNLPLIGLYSAFKELKNLDYTKVLVLPCDTPLVKYEVISLIINQSQNFDCCIPIWKDGLLEPLLAIYPIAEAYKTSLRNIKKNLYKLTKIISEEWKTNYISVEEEFKKIDPNLLSFKNINKLEDLKILKSLLNEKQ
jgi:molybdopterin-guanine dinucleotide biosynthesis protein A